MTTSHHDFFNGDADGVCSLHQLRLSNPIESTLVTGVKRDIALVKKIDVAKISSATILDVSFDKNREAVDDLLNADIDVQYFDHHFAGEVPENNRLDAHINTHAEICTGLLVNSYLLNAHLPWAIVAAYGDNLHTSARNAARSLNFDNDQLSELEELGTLLNYNGYGSDIGDLFFHPKDLYKIIKPYTDPFEFVHDDPAFGILQNGYSSDLEKANLLKPAKLNAQGSVLILPEEKWSRRISGVFGNELARNFPDRAHALLSVLPTGGYLVSVRAPLNRREGADQLCMQFETGGGRKAAAGINRLAENQLDKFIDRFYQQFC